MMVIRMLTRCGAGDYQGLVLAWPTDQIPCTGMLLSR